MVNIGFIVITRRWCPHPSRQSGWVILAGTGRGLTGWNVLSSRRAKKYSSAVIGVHPVKRAVLVFYNDARR